MPPVPRFTALAVVLTILPALLLDARAQESRSPQDLPFAGAEWKWTAPRELTAPELVPGAAGNNADVASTGTEALVVWSSRRRVLAAHVGPDGSPSAPILLGQRPEYAHDYPRVAWNGERYLVIWLSDYGYVEGQFLARDGSPIGQPVRFPAERATIPLLLVSNGDSFLVAFERGGYSSFAVNLVAPDGSIQSSISTGISPATAIASDGDDYLLLTRTTAHRISERGETTNVALPVAIDDVVWMGDHYLGVTASALQRLDRDGRALGAPIALDRLRYGRIDLLRLDGDSALVAEIGSDGLAGGLRLSRLDGDVVTAGTTTPAENQSRPNLARAGGVRLVRDRGLITQVEVDPASLSILASESSPVSLAAPDQWHYSAVSTNAGFFAAWREERFGVSSLMAAVIERDGEVATETLVTTPEEQGYGWYRLTPAVATSGDVVLVAWYEQGVRARRFTSSGEPLDPEPIDVAAKAASGYGVHASPAVAWNGETFALAWPDTTGMRVARMTADGVLLDGEGAAIPSTLSEVYAPSYPALASTGDVTLLVWQEGVFPYPCHITCEVPPLPQLMAVRLDRNLGRLDPEPFLLAPAGHHAFPTAAASGDGFLVAAVHVTDGSVAIRVGADGTIRDVPPLEELLRFPATSLADAETTALVEAEGIAVAGAPGGFVLAASTTGSRHYTEEPLASDDLRLTFVPREGAPSLPIVVTPGALHFPRPEIAIQPDGTMLVLYAGRRDDLGLATRASFQILRPLAQSRRRLAGR